MDNSKFYKFIADRRKKDVQKSLETREQEQQNELAALLKSTKGE